MENKLRPTRLYKRLFNLHNRLDIIMDELEEKDCPVEALMLRIAVRNIRKALDKIGERREL